MIYVKVKVRTLALLLLLVMAAAGTWAACSTLPSYYFDQGQYDKVLKRYPQHHLAQPSLFMLAEDAISSVQTPGEGLIYVLPSGASSVGGSLPGAEERARSRDKLEALIHQYEGTLNVSQLKYNLGKLYFQERHWDRAEGLFREISELPGETFLHSEELAKLLNILASRHEREGSAPSLEGQIVIGERPAAGAFVVLHRTDDYGWHSPPLLHERVAIADEQGNYRFYDTEPGEYEVGAGLRPEEIDGYYLTQNDSPTVKLTEDGTSRYDIRFVPQVTVISPVNAETVEGDELRFQWEPYEGADYYQISVTSRYIGRDGKATGSSVTMHLTDDKYHGTEAAFSVRELRKLHRGAGKSVDRDGNVLIVPSSLLGAVYPGGEFIWSVEAYSEDGRKLSSSAGYFMDDKRAAPWFRTAEDGMQEGDRLVLQARYEEAIAAYQKQGDDDHALRVLARFELIGSEEPWGRNPARVLAYLERIKEPSPSDLELMEEMRKRAAEVR